MTQSRERFITDVAGPLLEAAAGGEELGDALDRLRRHFDGSRACIQFYDADGQPGFNVANCRDIDFYRDVVSGGHDWNPPFVEYLARQPGTGTYVEDCLIDRASARNNSLWREVMAPRDMYGGMGWKVDFGSEGWCLFDIQRGRKQLAFSDTDHEQAASLGSIIAKAVEILRASQVRSRELERLRSALDAHENGVITFDNGFHVLDINKAAIRHLQSAGISRSDSRLRPAPGDIANYLALRQLFDQALGQQKSARMRRTIRHDQDMTILSFTAICDRIGRETIVHLYTSATGTADRQAVAGQIESVFGLSPRETEIALEILRGQSLQQIAVTTGTKHATIRTHIRNLFDKTGTQRQAQLALKLRDAAGLA